MTDSLFLQEPLSTLPVRKIHHKIHPFETPSFFQTPSLPSVPEWYLPQTKPTPEENGNQNLESDKTTQKKNPTLRPPQSRSLPQEKLPITFWEATLPAILHTLKAANLKIIGNPTVEPHRKSFLIRIPILPAQTSQNEHDQFRTTAGQILQPLFTSTPGYHGSEYIRIGNNIAALNFLAEST